VHQASRPRPVPNCWFNHLFCMREFEVKKGLGGSSKETISCTLLASSRWPSPLHSLKIVKYSPNVLGASLSLSYIEAIPCSE